ncbi:hypothetical protein VCHC69A1_3178B, partial [Vibrio cholerae HC-69A1]
FVFEFCGNALPAP